MKFISILFLAALSCSASAAIVNVRDDTVTCVDICGHDYACMGRCFDNEGDLQERRSAAQECVLGCSKDDYGCYGDCFNQ